MTRKQSEQRVFQMMSCLRFGNARNYSSVKQMDISMTIPSTLMARKLIKEFLKMCSLVVPLIFQRWIKYAFLWGL